MFVLNRRTSAERDHALVGRLEAELRDRVWGERQKPVKDFASQGIRHMSGCSRPKESNSMQCSWKTWSRGGQKEVARLHTAAIRYIGAA